jgi:hypothetical protein
MFVSSLLLGSYSYFDYQWVLTVDFLLLHINTINGIHSDNPMVAYRML